MHKSVTGVVIAVAGERFELLDDARRRHVFMPAMDASLEAGELPDLQRRGSRVTVEYDEDLPEGEVRVAHRVLAAPAAPHY